MKKTLLTITALSFLVACGNRTTNEKTAKAESKEVQTENIKTMEKINFTSEGIKLVGDLYYPSDYELGKKYPAIVVSGSWTTVKEQMAGLYAKKLAEAGYITLAFDFRNYGESEGEPRFYESPDLKKTDIKNAVSFLEGLPEIDNTKIGAFGVCAGAMYTLMAASEDDRIKSVVTTASWLHDAEAVKLFYGGAEGVNAKIEAAQNAKKAYGENGTVQYIPAISTEDESAAMYGPYDYYLNPERGAIPEWSADKFAVMSWEDWLTVDPMPTAKNLTVPTLMIHSDGAVLPQYTKKYFENITTADKKLHWMETELESPYHQFNYYDQDAEVKESVNEASKWFGQKLK
ncbi:alpha/beta fold hydrolase [Fulvivirgaceae bacterium BMA12]|uniref:Alpha/beta fold hydrolase n=1 Tax=Agaribacillus aureus TaxID=3051825 RepID=A0ABT8LKN7_9BACT|nr:alpha/beta fold hydrolase [Fulvivirgaceae bacterium BMA12]